MTKHFIVCRPMGGLNDMLCQITKCIIYGRRTNREIVIDTCPTHFNDSLANYLTPLQNDITVVEKEWINQNPMLTSLPKLECGLPISFKHHSEEGYLDVRSGQRLELDLTKEYKEDILVFQAHGGGDASHGVSRFFKVNDRVSSLIESELSKLPVNYISIHFRATDFVLSQDLKRLVDHVESSAKALRGFNVFVATDSRRILDACLEFFDPNFFFNFSGYLVEDECTLHHRESKSVSTARQREINQATFIDLALLSYGTKLFLPWTGASGLFSGFGRLANSFNLDTVSRASFFGIRR